MLKIKFPIRNSLGACLYFLQEWSHGSLKIYHFWNNALEWENTFTFNEQLRINHYTLFIVCLNFDRLLTPHKNSFDVSSKNCSVARSVLKCEMWKNCFTSKANATNHVLYTIHILWFFRVFVPFRGSLCIVYTQLNGQSCLTFTSEN